MLNRGLMDCKTWMLPMNALIPVLFTLAAGACLALQAPVNAALAARAGSVLFASLASFAVGSVALLGIWLATDREVPAWTGLTDKWIWTGGMLGAAYVAALAFAAPRLGIASALTIALASQLVVAVMIDHFGLLGMSVEALTARRMIGVALVLAGVAMIRW
jgi:transporter family-2 protein